MVIAALALWNNVWLTCMYRMVNSWYESTIILCMSLYNFAFVNSMNGIFLYWYLIHIATWYYHCANDILPRAQRLTYNAFCFRDICALFAPFVRLLPSMNFKCSDCGCSQFTNVFNPSSAEIVFRKSQTGSTEVERWWKLINHSCLPVIDVHDWSNKYTNSHRLWTG
jgi:hypothetical protein